MRMHFNIEQNKIIMSFCPVQALITPPLTETISVAHLMKTDVKLTTEVSTNIALQTFAVMGLNTGFGQAESTAKGKIHTVFCL